MNAITIQTIEDFADVLLAECGGDVDRAALSAAEDQVQTLRLWRRTMLERAGLLIPAGEASQVVPAPLQTDPDRPGLTLRADMAKLELPAPVRTPSPPKLSAEAILGAASQMRLGTFKFSTGELLKDMTVGRLQNLHSKSKFDALVSGKILGRLPVTATGTTLVVRALKEKTLQKILDRCHDDAR